ncbi:MAG: hypothetical protein AB3N23_15180 [Paracoccaceae bacterium]
MKLNRRNVLMLSSAMVVLASASGAQQARRIFHDALGTAQAEYDRFVTDRLFRNSVVRLVSSYKDATVRRQVSDLQIPAVGAEVRAGDDILALLLSGSDDTLNGLRSGVSLIRPFELNELADSFRSDGYERVMTNEFRRDPYSDFGLQMIEALAFYALTTRALVDSGQVDQSVFRSGEFCILPFWPFC